MPGQLRFHFMGALGAGHAFLFFSSHYHFILAEDRFSLLHPPSLMFPHIIGNEVEVKLHVKE